MENEQVKKFQNEQPRRNRFDKKKFIIMINCYKNRIRSECVRSFVFLLENNVSIKFECKIEIKINERKTICTA